MVALHPVIVGRANQVSTILSRRAKVRAVYVFGSTVSGATHQDSDIDLAIFVDGVETWGLEGRIRAIVEIQKEAGDDIDVHLFPASFVKSAPKGSFAEFVLEKGLSIGPKADGSIDETACNR